MDPMDAGLPVGHQLVAAVIHFDLERVNAILDANEDLDLNALPGAALVYRPPAAWHREILSNSGSILHVVASRQFGLGPRLPALDVSSCRIRRVDGSDPYAAPPGWRFAPLNGLRGLHAAPLGLL